MSIAASVIAEVHERSAGHCEGCGRVLPAEGGVMHHRKLRSHGGSDQVENLMELHAICHTGHRYSVHGAPARSMRLHHIVAEGEQPEDSVPIVELRLFKVRF